MKFTRIKLVSGSASFLDNVVSVFSSGSESTEKSMLEEEQDKLYKKIGRLQVENDF